jgi:TatD DNase family protein
VLGAQASSPARFATGPPLAKGQARTPVDGPEFDADREEVIQRAFDAEVTTILNVGTGDPHSDAFERAIELGKKHDSIYTAIGTHPHDARH